MNKDAEEISGALRYSCYISYAHIEPLEPFVSELYSDLSNEVALYGSKGVFRDRSEINPGENWSTAHEQALKDSACFIVLYTPAYFQKERAWCAREFRMMELIEEQRLEFLENKRPLIIPIIIRGRDSLPSVMRSRLHYDFSNLLLTGRFTGLPNYKEAIKEIAEYATSRCKELEREPEAVIRVRGIRFPEPREIDDWLNEAIGTKDVSAPFGRDGAVQVGECFLIIQPADLW